jgi:hypothetical protein
MPALSCRGTAPLSSYSNSATRRAGALDGAKGAPIVARCRLFRTLKQQSPKTCFPY